jgi:hypothetical protein
MEHLNEETPANTQVAETTTQQGVETTTDYEKRYKDAQAWGTKTSQENASLKAELEAIKQVVPKAIKLNLSEDVQEELDNLLDTDPDAWRVKMNQLEEEATTNFNMELEQAQASLLQKSELARREQVLEAFVNRPDTVLTTDSLGEIPVRLQNKLESGEITFDEFLVESDTYLKQGKTVLNPETPTSNPLNKSGGTNTPTTNSKDVNASYEEIMF